MRGSQQSFHAVSRQIRYGKKQRDRGTGLKMGGNHRRFAAYRDFRRNYLRPRSAGRRGNWKRGGKGCQETNQPGSERMSWDCWHSSLTTLCRASFGEIDGAGTRNRTATYCLEGSHSAVKPCPPKAELSTDS